MKIAPFLKEYIRATGDEHAKLEIEELALEYNLRKNLLNTSPESASAIELQKEFVEKARKIARPWAKDKIAFEKMVWRQNSELFRQDGTYKQE